METLGQRIKRLRDQSKMTQEALSRASGITQTIISRLEQDKAKSTRDIVALAASLGVTAEELETGAPPRGYQPPVGTVNLSLGGTIGSTSLSLGERTNATPGPAIRGLVPLISWVQAGGWSEVVDNYAPYDGEEWLPCPVKHGSHTFVLRVYGESMFNPHGRPSFMENDLIFVDPDRRPEHRSLVVVRKNEEMESTFKMLLLDGGKHYIKALNPAWPSQIEEMTGDITICGVVIAKMEKF